MSKANYKLNRIRNKSLIRINSSPPASVTLVPAETPIHKLSHPQIALLVPEPTATLIDWNEMCSRWGIPPTLLSHAND